MLTPRLGWPLLLLLGLLPGLAASSAAQSVRVDAFVDADSLRIGEQTTLWMVVEHSFQSEVSFPEADTGPTLFGDLEVLAKNEPGYRYRGTSRPGGRVDSVGYTVTTFALDAAAVPALPVWVVANADTTIAGSRPFTVPVPSVLPSDTTTAMQPLMPPAPFPYGWRMWAAAAALLLALLAAGFWGYRRHAASQQNNGMSAGDQGATVYDTTCATLDRLTPPPTDAPSKAFYIALTRTVRSYLAERLHVPAHERTSAELADMLQQHPRIPRQAAGRIQAVLELADLAKFADTRPDAAANETALHETRKAVDAIEDRVTETYSAPENEPSEAASAVASGDAAPHPPE